MQASNPPDIAPWSAKRAGPRDGGYAIGYRSGEQNFCPGCGKEHWMVGRLVAECAFCGTALSLTHVSGFGAVQPFCHMHGGSGLAPANA